MLATLTSQDVATPGMGGYLHGLYWYFAVPAPTSTVAIWGLEGLGKGWASSPGPRTSW